MKHTEVITHIYVDGACRGNPGRGGWGVLLQAGTAKKELWGGEHETTNNRMELTAVIRALEALKRQASVHIHTDSQYVQKANGFTAGNGMAGKQPIRSRLKMPTSGNDLMHWHKAMKSPGRGSRDMPVIQAMSAPTPLPIVALMNCLMTRQTTRQPHETQRSAAERISLKAAL